MCGPFKGCSGVLRLLEMILSLLTFILVMMRGSMHVPWGVWCEFVWVFCFVVPLVIVIVEGMAISVLLETIINWDDLKFGLTFTCTLMICSASVVYASGSACYNCWLSILVVLCSSLASAAFLLDVVLQKCKAGINDGYMSKCRGALRVLECFVGSILITAASNHFIAKERDYRPVGMLIAVCIFIACLLMNVALILLNLVKLLRKLMPKFLEKLYNVAAFLAYLLALVLWLVYGYRQYFNQAGGAQTHICKYCHDLHTVMAGSVINTLLYIIDAVVIAKG